MKTLTNLNILLVIANLFMISSRTNSLSIHNREGNDEIPLESNHIDDIAFAIDQQVPMDNPFSPQIHPFLNKRRLDSAEKYFDWASKTHRPMEYLRGKRFWFFAKKDENGKSQETISSSANQGSRSRGLWRSGIVGRRRR